MDFQYPHRTLKRCHSPELSDFYAGQRCWATCCGMILVARYPKDTALARVGRAISSMSRPGLFTHPQARPRRTAQLAWERLLLAICQPFLADPLAVQAKLCRRIERHTLFVFVAEPDGRTTTRSLRHRHQPQGQRGKSERGTESKMTPPSSDARGLNPLAACRQRSLPPKSERTKGEPH